MTEFQRKIELQSLDDLQYLVSNLRRAAYGKIEKDLPSMEGEDPMRMCVESIVSQVQYHPSPTLPFFLIISLSISIFFF